MRKFISGKKRRRTFDNKSLKVIGGMGITCRRGWGAKWNEVENHLRKMRTYVIRRRKSVTRICYCDARRYLFEINEKWILGVDAAFFFEYSYGRVYPSVNRQRASIIYALEWRKCWMTRKIFIHSRVMTEDKFVSLWMLPHSFVLSFFFHIIIVHVCKISA